MIQPKFFLGRSRGRMMNARSRRGWGHSGLESDLPQSRYRSCVPLALGLTVGSRENRNSLMFLPHTVRPTPRATIKFDETCSRGPAEALEGRNHPRTGKFCRASVGVDG